MKLRAIVVDDEALAREGLRLLLERDGQVDIVEECANGRQAITAIQQHQPDVVFLDVQMPGEDGFDVIRRHGAARKPIFIFITAYDAYAVRAFEVEALDYLTKPVEIDRLEHTLRRVREALATQAAPITQEQLRSVVAAIHNGSAPVSPHPQRLMVRNGTSDVFVAVDEIQWIEADSYYSRLHVGSKRYLLRETIKQLASTLDPAKFVRVHRSAIVNLDCVREILREGQNDGWLVLCNGHRVKMSKSGWQSLLEATRG